MGEPTTATLETRWGCARVNANDTVMAELEILSEYSKGKILWISSAPYAALLTRTNCSPLSEMKESPVAISGLLQANAYEAIFIARRMQKSASGEFTWLDPQDELDPKVFELEEVELKRFGTTMRLKVDRIIRIY